MKFYRSMRDISRYLIIICLFICLGSFAVYGQSSSIYLETRVLYNFETLEIEISSCEGHLATLKKEDLDELVGNILEVNLQDYFVIGSFGFIYLIIFIYNKT